MNPKEAPIKLYAAQEDAGQRLDLWLPKQFSGFSRCYFQHLIAQHLVRVNGSPTKKRMLLQAGDTISVELAFPQETSLEPQPIPFDILYEDSSLIAINKPPGMVVHPAAGHWENTFANGLVHHCKSLNPSSLRPGIVHRLDKDTSGILLAAKTETAQSRLASLFAERKVEKTYLAVCLNQPGNRLIEARIGRHPKKRQEMTVLTEGGRHAVTHCRTLHTNNGLSLVRLRPETGRTHQLRVHLKSIGCPILGDPLYGAASHNQKYAIFRQLLHAVSMRFIHPSTSQVIELNAPIPQDMQKFIKMTGYAPVSPKSGLGLCYS